MKASAVLDSVQTALKAVTALSSWTIHASSVPSPADKQIDMILSDALAGAMVHGVDKLEELLILRLSRATKSYTNLSQATRDLLDLRDPVTKAVLNALDVPGTIELYPDNAERPSWTSYETKGDATANSDVFIVLEFRVPFDRLME